MRPAMLAWSVVLLSAAAAVPLRAQDPADQPVEQDSLSTDDGWQDEDTLPVEPRQPRHRDGSNPYLREVREESHGRRRGNFWAAGSLGVGGEAIAAPGSMTPWGQSRTAPTLSFGIGGTLSNSFRLGVEGFAWFKPGDQTLESVTTLMVTGRLYPLARSGLFLKSGIGFGRYGVDEFDNCGCGNTTLVSDYGLAWSVGAGFETPVSHGLSIGPMVEMTRMNVSGPDGYRERVVNFGISLTFDGAD